MTIFRVYPFLTIVRWLSLLINSLTIMKMKSLIEFKKITKS
jgi:hypothetical protein